ncbi:class F sortase, partial [Streptomyces sp. NPDC057638]|uniref:class F sortase n=1 Tax=Streptomyces sp. NPDC057638 TaxID=3346190 RepID=UPI0036981EA6
EAVDRRVGRSADRGRRTPAPQRRGAWFSLLCALLLGGFLLAPESVESSGIASRPGGPDLARAGTVAWPLSPVPDPLPHSPPRRITVRALGVDAPVRAVGLEPDGSIAAPPVDEENLAGWYAGAVTPGERGTAVVVGHVDTTRGPAVFSLLGSLQRGSAVEILRADGRTAVFQVDRVETHGRSGFPSQRVYRDAPRPELRLITCGGRFVPGAGYDANVVVFAHATSVR